MRPTLALIGLSFALAWAVFNNGGAEAEDWRVSVFAVAAVGTVYWVRVRRWERAPRLERNLRWPVILLLACGAAQLLPLPSAVVEVLSPRRAELARTFADLTGTPPGWTPLSVVSGQSLEQLVRITTCILVALLIREICWHFERRAWVTVIPVVLVAVCQGAIGLAQYYGGDPPARGSYVNRNHFAGLLEMTVPFALVYPAVVISQSRIRWRAPARPALLASAAIVIALIMLFALLHSLSRMGFLAGLVAVLVSVLGVIWTTQTDPARRSIRGRRYALALAPIVLTGAVLFFVYLAPDDLVARFRAIRTFDVEDRPQLWREALPLMRSYAVAGCGLGGFESAFMRYKTSGPTYTDDFAHNDYLQYMAELGIVGFCAGALAVAACIAMAVRAAAPHRPSQTRCLAIACMAALAAIGFHSAVDFNLYIPANSMLFGWIAGIACGAALSSHTTSPAEAVEILTVTHGGKAWQASC